jgi:predicted dehydrogenase
MQLAREVGRPLDVGFQKRHAPTYVETARRVRRWGALAHVGINFTVGPMSPAEFRRDVAIHALDLARFFGGDVARLVFERHESGDGVTWAVVLRFVCGATGTLTLSNQRGWGQPNERVELTACGGWLVVDNLLRLTVYPRDDTPPGLAPGNRVMPRTWEPSLTVPTAETGSLFLQGYVGELRAFARAVLDGKPSSSNIARRPSMSEGAADIADGVAALRLVEALGGPTGRVVEMEA